MQGPHTIDDYYRGAMHDVDDLHMQIVLDKMFHISDQMI
jgi:hypothetical protein